MINYSEEWIVPLIFRLNGSVTVRASLFAIPAAIFSLFLVLLAEWHSTAEKDFEFETLNKSTLWSASYGVVGILLGFRTNRAMARFWEGTGLLHQMRGEWFDSVSCCVTFSRAAVNQKPEEVDSFRHTIVRLMSLCHGSALEEIAGSDAEECETIDSFGLDNQTLQHLKECKEVHMFNRVEVLLHMIQSLITKALDDGVLKIPPPILSRVYQTLSRGFVNLLNAKKIADTRFPFPYVQLITMLLCLHMFLTPLMMCALLRSRVWTPLFTFVPMFGMFSINFIGVELENPFGNDANDLPLDHFQAEMNKCLLMLLQDNADLIAGVSKTRCTRDFDTLNATLNCDANHGQTESHYWKEIFGGWRIFQYFGWLQDEEEHHRMASKRLSQFADYVDMSADEDGGSDEEELSKAKENADAAKAASAAAAAAKAKAPPPEPKAAPPEPKALPPPPAAPTPVVEPSRLSTGVLEKSVLEMEEFSSALQDLKRSVDTQANDLSRSIKAVKDFSTTLPVLLHSLAEDSRERERRNLLERQLPMVNGELANGVGISRLQREQDGFNPAQIGDAGTNGGIPVPNKKELLGPSFSAPIAQLKIDPQDCPSGEFATPRTPAG